VEEQRQEGERNSMRENIDSDWAVLVKKVAHFYSLVLKPDEPLQALELAHYPRD
jgi:hypothetical protein